MSVFKDILAALKALLPAPLPTYSVDIGVVAGGAGYAAELIPGGVPVVVKSIWFSKPSAAITYRVIKASTPSTAGTSTDGVAVRHGGASTARARTKLFTAAPTAGVAIGDLFAMAVGTGDNVDLVFGDNGTEPLVIEGNERLGINVSAAATIVGRIVFQERA